MKKEILKILNDEIMDLAVSHEIHLSSEELDKRCRSIAYRISKIKKQTSERKNFKVPIEVYKEITDAYQKLKGIVLVGAEFSTIKRDIKTMLLSGRTKENIIEFMMFCSQICKRIEEGDEDAEKEFGWFQNWTILTIKKKMPEFLAGKFQKIDNDIEIPSYAKQFQNK